MKYVDHDAIGADPAKAEQATAADSTGEAAVARELRVLGREIAGEARRTPGGAGVDATAYGWRLWTGLRVRGEAVYHPPSPGFGWWHYSKVLMLRLDGEIVEAEERDGSMDSPNYQTPGPTPRPAADSSLFWPDVVKRDWQKSVEEAPARTMTDEYAVPVTTAAPLGAGLRAKLEAIRAGAAPPQPLTRERRETSTPRPRRRLDRMPFVVVGTEVLAATLLGVLSRTGPAGAQKFVFVLTFLLIAVVGVYFGVREKSAGTGVMAFVLAWGLAAICAAIGLAVA
jgi:hypothetical protein